MVFAFNKRNKLLIIYIQTLWEIVLISVDQKDLPAITTPTYHKDNTLNFYARTPII